MKVLIAILVFLGILFLWNKLSSLLRQGENKHSMRVDPNKGSEKKPIIDPKDIEDARFREIDDSEDK